MGTSSHPISIPNLCTVIIHESQRRGEAQLCEFHGPRPGLDILGTRLGPGTIVQLVYVAAHWKESKDGFFLQVTGLVLMILAAITGVPVS